MKKSSPVRRLRLALNAIAIVLVTLLARNFYDDWKKKEALEKIINACELPSPPEGATLHRALSDESANGKYMFFFFSLSGEMKEMDAWLDQVDRWKESTPSKIKSFRIRESESESRIDFCAECSLEDGRGPILISETHGTPAPPAAK